MSFNYVLDNFIKKSQPSGLFNTLGNTNVHQDPEGAGKALATAMGDRYFVGSMGPVAQHTIVAGGNPISYQYTPDQWGMLGNIQNQIETGIKTDSKFRSGLANPDTRLSTMMNRLGQGGIDFNTLYTAPNLSGLSNMLSGVGSVGSLLGLPRAGVLSGVASSLGASQLAKSKEQFTQGISKGLEHPDVAPYISHLKDIGRKATIHDYGYKFKDLLTNIINKVKEWGGGLWDWLLNLLRKIPGLTNFIEGFKAPRRGTSLDATDTTVETEPERSVTNSEVGV
jgi:hypothetical protein